MKPFEYKLDNLTEIRGFTKCMDVVLKYIEEVTQFKPEKRMIDAVPLLDKITATNKELSELLKKESEEIQNA